VRFIVDEVPDKAVGGLIRDSFQPRTWYAGSGPAVFRSLNNGESWEPIGTFADGPIDLTAASPDVPGLLAVTQRLTGQTGSRVHISRDCGETWDATAHTLAFEVEGMAWSMRGDLPVLLMATDTGLYELVLRPGGNPVQVLVDPQDQNRGFYAVAASRDLRGQLVNVAVAAQGTGGVYLSREGGQPNTFRHIGLRGEDIRVLAVQYDGTRSFLWAGVTAIGPDDPGTGCFSWEYRGLEDPPERWRAFKTGWTAGSCRSLAIMGTTVFAATYRGGVLRLNTTTPDAQWETPDVRCGLPLRDRGRFQPVNTVAADPGGGFVLAGTEEGIFRSRDQGGAYEKASQREFTDKVPLPQSWLFCSGEHELTVIGEDEAERD
jgi:hypothetical protein